MPPRDWTDDDAYTYLDALDASGFAWEALRRNPAYVSEFQGSAGGLADFPARWGLRFPGRS